VSRVLDSLFGFAANVVPSSTSSTSPRIQLSMRYRRLVWYSTAFMRQNRSRNQASLRFRTMPFTSHPDDHFRHLGELPPGKK